MRFVILSFIFLGWAFWELSGGSDFEPRGIRSAPVETASVAPRPEPKSLVEIRADTLVAKPALTPQRTVQNVQSEPEVEDNPEQTLKDNVAQLALARTQLGSGLDLFASQNDQTLTLASLEQGATSLTTVETAPEPTETVAEPIPEPVRDIREVTGTRVNMRDGPGTVFPVIGRLNIGHQVEVLGESGTGWLRLRVLPEQNIGWIAASLVSKKAD